MPKAKVTPLLDNEIDYKSLVALVKHYAGKDDVGLVPLAATGEGPAIADNKYSVRGRIAVRESGWAQAASRLDKRSR